MDLCACESEEHELGVGAGANTTLLQDTLEVKGCALSEGVSQKEKKVKKNEIFVLLFGAGWNI
jgi:hypothetical protein